MILIHDKHPLLCLTIYDSRKMNNAVFGCFLIFRTMIVIAIGGLGTKIKLFQSAGKKLCRFEPQAY